jgi:hypothetical protein
MITRTKERRFAISLVINFAIALFIGLSPTARIYAQTVTGDVVGKVTDRTGSTVAGAMVTVTNRGTGSVRKATTDKQGEFRVASLPAADYMLEVQSPGFAMARSSFKLTVGQSFVVNPVLLVSGVQETIDVSTGAAGVQSESSELGGLIGQKQILELPLNGRSIDQLALLEPGVSSTTNRFTGSTIHGTQLNIDGAAAKSNRFLLDGTNVGDTYNYGVGSIAGVFLGVDAVQEFRVLTNSYSAEYGQTTGGVITVATKSGSNAFHGSAFEYFRDGKLDARNFFDSEKPSFRRNQFGFSAGGPIVKDKTFFFAAGELLREKLGLTVLTVVPSLDARRGVLPDSAHPGQFITVPVNPDIVPYLNLFPLPNGRDFGNGLAQTVFPFSQRTTESFYQGRVDHHFNSRNSFFARYTFDDTSLNPPPTFPAWAQIAKSRNQYITLEGTTIISSALVNIGRLSFARTNLTSADQLVEDIPASAILIPGRQEAQIAIGGMPNTGPGAAPTRKTLQLQNLFSWSDDMSLAKGPHLLKWGLLIDRAQNFIETDAYFGGRLSFPSISQFIQGRASTLTIAAAGSDPRQYLFHTRFGAYVQDQYKLLRNLVVNIGLRQEFSTVPTEKHGHLVGLRDPLHDPFVTIGQPFKNHKQNLAPRVGVAWDPLGDGKTVVRSGFGIFYDINAIPYLAQKINGNPPFNNRLTVINPSLHPNLSTVQGSLNLAVPAYDWQTPHALHYNLAVERELTSGTALTLAYAGSRGINTARTGEANAPLPQSLPDGRPFYSPTATRRNPKLGSVSFTRPDGNSWYNALQLKVVSRIGPGFRVQGSYTFSRTIDESQGIISGDANGSVPFAWDPDDPKLDKGLADFHRKHILVANWTWDMPFFRDRNDLVSALLGHWSLNGIITALSGNPFTPGVVANVSGTRPSNDATSIDRPNINPGFNANNVIRGGPDQYFNPNAFSVPTPGTFGNLARNVLIGPGLATVDMSALKNFPLRVLGENAKLQLRVEAFNLLNRANFNLPNRIVFTGPGSLPLRNAGQITSTSTTSRQIQLALRFNW